MLNWYRVDFTYKTTWTIQDPAHYVRKCAWNPQGRLVEKMWLFSRNLINKVDQITASWAC